MVKRRYLPCMSHGIAVIGKVVLTGLPLNLTLGCCHRLEQAKEEERKFGVEDSKLPGAPAQPPAPSPVGAGVLSGSALSGERQHVQRNGREGHAPSTYFDRGASHARETWRDHLQSVLSYALWKSSRCISKNYTHTEAASILT